MVAKKKDNMNDLYVNLSDTTNKRKNILSAIKNSLIMQEEFEKVFGIRKEKQEVLLNIKKKMSLLNSNYQNLNKSLPNVKNVISFTEKELTHLEGQVNMLSRNVTEEKEEIDYDKDLIKKLNSGKKMNSNNLVSKKTSISKKHKLITNHSNTNNLSKLDRIKNNLKVIESKLNHI